MKINTKELQNALSIALRSAKAKHPEILKAVKMEFEDGQCSILATDLDCSVKIPVACDGSLKSVCIDARSLSGIVARLTDDQTVLSLGEKNLTIHRKGGDIRLRTQSADNFPEFPTTEHYSVSFKPDELLELCRAVLLGTTEDEMVTKEFTTVAQLQIDRNLIEGKYRCYSTDTTRIAVVTGLCDTEEKEVLTWQIPVRVFRSLLALKPKSDIEIEQGEKHIFVRADSVLYAFRRVTAVFPNIDAYLSSANFDQSVPVDADRLRESLELVGQVVNPMHPIFKMSLNGSLTLSAQHADIGAIEEEIDTDVDLEPFDTGFNINFILPMLRQLSGDIELQFRKDVRPGKDPGTTRTTYPLRIKKSANKTDALFDVQAVFLD